MATHSTAFAGHSYVLGLSVWGLQSDRDIYSVF